jgi:hypothetical protein
MKLHSGHWENKQANKQAGLYLRVHIQMASMKMAFFWIVATAPMVKEGRTSETSVNVCQTTWSRNKEDSHLLTFI